jgi:hypothetical protein
MMTIVTTALQAILHPGQRDVAKLQQIRGNLRF